MFVSFTIPDRYVSTQRAAALDERLQPRGDARLQHEQHRRHQQAVGLEVRQALDHVDADPELPERAVVLGERRHVLLVEA